MSDKSTEANLYSTRVPRYTSYPTAPHFDGSVDFNFTENSLAQLRPSETVSVYIHIPFCKRICWFCACRTQGTNTLRPVKAYLDVLKSEIDLVRSYIPDGVKIGHLHLGGGTPTILEPDLISDLMGKLLSSLPLAEQNVFSVEIDPTDVTEERINCLRSWGMNRASIGIQDFDPTVQLAIGRSQSFEITKECVSQLRAAGIKSLNADILYGLPFQNQSTLNETLDKIELLSPDRIAAFGYAHVPWMSKRQQLIAEDKLPGPEDRLQLAEQIRTRFRSLGYKSIGIDHFAQPGDRLSKAASKLQLRRNFQGYTEDTFETLIGLGLSSISRYRQGYAQNASMSAEYTAAIENKVLATKRGHVFRGEDLVRGRAIEMLMSNFEINFAALEREFGSLSVAFTNTIKSIGKKYRSKVQITDRQLKLTNSKTVIARLVSSELDEYMPDSSQQYSSAI